MLLTLRMDSNTPRKKFAALSMGPPYIFESVREDSVIPQYENFSGLRNIELYGGGRLPSSLR